jgi:DNA-binding MarR family transcriptional regulator
MENLSIALGVLSNLREIDPDMPVSEALSLLLIAKYDGLSLKDLASKADVGMASASRYVRAFSVDLSLATAKEDPVERRKKVISLTAKGKTVVKKILEAKHAYI